MKKAENEMTEEERKGEPGEKVRDQWFVEDNQWWCLQPYKKDGTQRRDKSICKKCDWGENQCSDCGTPCCDLVMDYDGECPDCAENSAICRASEKIVREEGKTVENV